ncbi:MAG: phosphoenolpyruvate--protein phosphotransferase [Polyangiaceae bacterium]
MAEAGEAGPLVLEGIAGAPGLAVGQSVVVDTRRSGVVRRQVEAEALDGEVGRFETAVRSASRALREVAAKVRSSRARAESSILDAYVLMVEDESLRSEVVRRIREDHQSAEWALDTTVRGMADQLRQAENPYLAERSHDFEFIGERILMALTGEHKMAILPEQGEPVVVVARDLSPAETASFSRDRVRAIVTEVGTRTNHTAILARALEIPAVVGVSGLLDHVGAGDRLVVDGNKGRVIVGPDAEMVSDVMARAERQKVQAEAMLVERDRPATTRCGVIISLKANIELPGEAEAAVRHGAEGVGLYRTEFLFLDRSEPPSEEDQYRVYRKVLETVAPRPVTLRTFDIGGDKFGSAFQVPADMNPALGLRAVRLGLARPELFGAQLRAMVRASAHGKMSIMVPMVASLSELRAVRGLLARAIEEVDQRGAPRARALPLGVMVEVPSAAIMARELAREAEFLSIGTNDLVQYALAVDRGSPGLAYLASPFDPAILRLIQRVVEAGEEYRREVSVCGAMASDPSAAVLLVGLGVRALSLEGAAIPTVKAAIGRFGVIEARELALRALSLSTASEIEEVVEAALGHRLADLVNQP